MNRTITLQRNVNPHVTPSRRGFLYASAALAVGAASTQVFSAQPQESPVSQSPQQPQPSIPLADSAPLDGTDGRDLSVRLFRPQSTLVLPHRLPERAKFSAIDVHTHTRHKLAAGETPLQDFVRLMDRQNIKAVVCLDGGWGEKFFENRDRLWKNFKDRFVIFGNIDWRGSNPEEDETIWDCHRPDFARTAAERIHELKVEGASGVKIFKDFGLRIRNQSGRLLRINEERWNPIWEACGKNNLPILIHAADPVAFFQPINAHNERWEELGRHPDWSFHGDRFPSHRAILDDFMDVVKRHPQTKFIGAHVANFAENLAQVGAWLDQFPNLYIEIAARIGELGRQPYTARKFFLKYADRILFGTDGPRQEDRIRAHWQFLETDNEYFPYAGPSESPPQGLWNIHGVYLPDDVLKKIYSENAMKLIPDLRNRVV